MTPAGGNVEGAPAPLGPLPSRRDPNSPASAGIPGRLPRDGSAARANPAARCGARINEISCGLWRDTWSPSSTAVLEKSQYVFHGEKHGDVME